MEKLNVFGYEIIVEKKLAYNLQNKIDALIVPLSLNSMYEITVIEKDNRLRISFTPKDSSIIYYKSKWFSIDFTYDRLRKLTSINLIATQMNHQGAIKYNNIINPLNTAIKEFVFNDGCMQLERLSQQSFYQNVN